MSYRKQTYFAEIRTQTILAIPVLLAQISQVSMGFVDTVMTAQVSPVDMAAVALAASLWLPIILFGQGVIMAVTPAIAQLRGAGRTAEVGVVSRQGIWLALILSAPLMALLCVLSYKLETLGAEPHLADMAGRYLRAMAWGGPGYLLFIALRCTSEGYARVRPAMVVGFAGLAVNIPCNYILIFGKFGFPALGGVGAGVASALACWSMFLVMLLYSFKMPDIRATLSLSQWQLPHWPTVRSLVSVGLPGAFAMLCEVTLFAVVAVLIAPLGAIMVAGHQVALNFSSIVFMLPLSLGMAATIRVGYNLGQKNPTGVKIASRVSLTLGLILSLFTALATVLLREHIAAGYSNSDPQVTALASALLVFAATYQCTDSIQVVSVGILRAYNDTRAILAIVFVSYWLMALPLGYTLGCTDLIVPSMGPHGFWIAFIVGISVSACLLLYRVRVLERRLFAGHKLLVTQDTV